MQLLLRYLKQYWRLSLYVVVLAAINQIFSLLDPLIFQKIIDTYALHIDSFTTHEFIRGVGILLLGTVAVAFVSRVAKNFQDYYLNTIVQKIGAQMYTTGVRHILSLPYTVFEDTRSGETLSVLQKTRTDVEKFMLAFINVFFVSIVGFVFVSIYAISLYWVIAVIFLVSVPIIGGVSYYLSHRIKTVQKNIVVETNALAGSTTESLRNIELVKSLGLDGQEVDRLNTTTEKILNLELQKLRTIRAMSFVQGTCVNLLRAGIMFVLLYLIYDGHISYGQFFTLQIYSFFVFGPLQQIGDVFNSYRDAQVSLSRYNTLMTIPVEATPKHPASVNAIHQLELRNVSLVYPGSNELALDQVSCVIHRGQTVAFVGPSGSGKTSLVKLLVGLYQPISGSVLYNDIPHSQVSIRSVREHVGFVTQETQLFAGTIRENLLFVRPNATDTECMAALLASACHSLLERAGDGLDTRIGEGGVKVSGGERQRLSIARALLRNPSVLICDEATSALDSITEQEITDTLRNINGAGDRITILIAHRLSTIMHADRIVVLERGRIAESGTHDELIQANGLYHAMWRQQVGERPEVSIVTNSKNNSLV